MEAVDMFEVQYEEKGFAAQRRYPNESFLSFLGEHYFTLEPQQRRGLKVLELGCGSGANLWMVAREGFQTYGIDLAATGLVYCRYMLDSWGVAAQLVRADMQALPFDNDSFDVLYDIVSMQHLDFKQHGRAWSEVYRCLKVGGRFYSYHLGENSISLKSTEDMIDHCTVRNVAPGYPLANNGPTCFLSANEVRQGLLEHGFHGIVVDKITRSYHDQRQHVEYLSIVAMK